MHARCLCALYPLLPEGGDDELCVVGGAVRCQVDAVVVQDLG